MCGRVNTNRRLPDGFPSQCDTLITRNAYVNENDEPVKNDHCTFNIEIVVLPLICFTSAAKPVSDCDKAYFIKFFIGER